ncbi:MAG: ribose-5-phosphate isomerase RpiA [Gemmatimonadetes bacterium]|nr:ribose-5-phosphate isomerase RpiA [Gemmatimonadota bacterium]
MTDADGLKRAAAERAIEWVESGMRLGLGTGSTVAHFLDVLGERLRSGSLTGLIGVPTSVRTESRARGLGIALAELSEAQPLDLTVDGADEVDPGLDLVKGLGGALLREKMVAQASRRLVIMVDDSKRVRRLGTKAPLPVEVTRFGWRAHVPFLTELGCEPVLRLGANGSPYLTDNGNHMLDCRFPQGMDNPGAVEDALRRRAGVVESGLFLGMATAVVVAGAGGITVLERGGA